MPGSPPPPMEVIRGERLRALVPVSLLLVAAAMFIWPEPTRSVVKFGVLVLFVAYPAMLVRGRAAARRAALAAIPDPVLGTDLSGRADLWEPIPLRRLTAWSAVSAIVCWLLIIASLVPLWIGGTGAAVALAVAGPLMMLLVGALGEVWVRQRRKAVVNSVRAVQWRACTRCAYPLESGGMICPECGLEITGEQAQAAWMRQA